jgi:hypothetical protein
MPSYTPYQSGDTFGSGSGSGGGSSS